MKEPQGDSPPQTSRHTTVRQKLKKYFQNFQKQPVKI